MPRELLKVDVLINFNLAVLVHSLETFFHHGHYNLFFVDIFTLCRKKFCCQCQRKGCMQYIVRFETISFTEQKLSQLVALTTVV